MPRAVQARAGRAGGTLVHTQTVSTKTRRRWRRTSVAVAVAGGLALASAFASTPDTPTEHGDRWRSLTSSDDHPSPYDAGGSDANARLMLEGAGRRQYSVYFRARGETLRVSDAHADGRRAQAEVRVYRRADADGIPHDLVDRSTKLFTGTRREFDLGTPGSIGDIPEGYRVAIRVRPEGTRHWSDWAYGRA